MALVRTLGLVVVLSLIFTGVGWLVGSYFFGDWLIGSLVFLVLAGSLNVLAYFFSDRIVLWSYRARMLKEKENPALFRVVRELSAGFGLPMPRVALIPSRTPNAMATGRGPRHAVVAVTQGILEILEEGELKGVLARELSHIQNRDVLVMTLAATLAGAVGFLSRLFLWGSLAGGGNRSRNGTDGIVLLAAAITAPLAALPVQLAVSREREYGADRTGALATRAPESLASALKKLERANRARPFHSGNPASAGLFIANPFRGGVLLTLFSTHPPTDRRIARLLALKSSLPAYDPAPALGLVLPVSCLPAS